MPTPTPTAAALIRAHYPLRLVAWVDGVHLRIGHGHVIQPHWDRHLFGMAPQALASIVTASVREKRLTFGLNIDRDAAASLLAADLDQAARFIHTVTGLRCQREGRPLTAGQFDALCALVHITGQGRYATSSLRRAIELNDMAVAGVCLGRWPDLLERFQAP